MEHTVYFDLDGYTTEVLAIRYRFSRSIDMNGRPASRTRLQELSLELRSEHLAMKNTLLLWLTDDYLAKSGRIVFYSAAQPQTILTEILFSNGYLVNFEEIFDTRSTFPPSIRLQITASDISINNHGRICENWPEV